MVKYVLLLATVAVLAMTATSAPRKRRVTEEEALIPLDRYNTTVTTVICNPDTNCGWTIYTPFTKNIEYFIKNTYCNCLPGTECLYYEDDLSIGSFVHRCIEPTNTTTTTDNLTNSL